MLTGPVGFLQENDLPVSRSLAGLTTRGGVSDKIPYNAPDAKVKEEMVSCERTIHIKKGVSPKQAKKP